MSLRTRIVLINAVVLALAILATGAALVSFARGVAPLRRAISEEARSVQLAEALRRQLDQEASTVSQALARGDRESSLAYRSANLRFDGLLDEAATLAADAPARAALDEARAGEAAFNARADEALARASDQGTALRLLTDSVLPARDAADVALDRFLDQQQAFTRAAEHQASDAAISAVTMLAALLAVAGAAAALASLWLSRHLLVRMGLLGRATEAVAGGERGVYVPVPGRGGDELDHLARAFNGMVRQLAGAEAAARAADELKASFLASVSHDLRTPITTVKGMVDTLLREDVQWDDATQRELLETAARESDRLARLVTNLLDLSRLEAGAWPLHLEAVDLPVLARGVVTDLSYPGGPLDGRSVTVEAQTEHPAWADEDQMVRVLQNLLTNAAKFSRPEQPIQVDIDSDGDTVAVHVLDRGPGVSDVDRAHVFDKFFRTHAARPPVPGTGLGLAICRGIVAAHGGQIWVQPGPGGTGARFSFTVPTIPSVPEATVVIRPTASMTSLPASGADAPGPEPARALAREGAPA